MVYLALPVSKVNSLQGKNLCLYVFVFKIANLLLKHSESELGTLCDSKGYMHSSVLRVHYGLQVMESHGAAMVW